VLVDEDDEVEEVDELSDALLEDELVCCAWACDRTAAEAIVTTRAVATAMRLTRFIIISMRGVEHS